MNGRQRQPRIDPDPTDAVNAYTLHHVDRLYASYISDPSNVSRRWRSYFDSFRNGNGNGSGDLRASTTMPNGRAMPGAPDRTTRFATDPIVQHYRTNGHRFANLNPLSRTDADAKESLPPGLAESNLSDAQRRTIRRCRDTYCGSLGVQFMHLGSADARAWIAERMERRDSGDAALTSKRRRRILRRLTEATVFERFLTSRYVGAKTFGIEGAEALIPLLDDAVECAGREGVEQVVIGMAHRGRLNVLTNIIGKPASRVFREFDDADPQRYFGGGDVKYHLGHSDDRTTDDGHDVHLSLCFNPSHVEFINPVAMGRTRAKQDRLEDPARRRALLVLVHGDAALAGEGVVSEALNLTRLNAYDVGGSLHVVINNQLGFTTTPEQGRSTHYCTDIALVYDMPVLHVNADNPEAVARAVDIAMGYRDRFNRDVFIDLIGYRRHGHNEADEPAFTQPGMYQRIDEHPPVLDRYADTLIERGVVDQDTCDELANQYKQRLESALDEARQATFPPRRDGHEGVWKDYRGGVEHDIKDPDTDVDGDRLVEILRAITTFPEGFTPHRKVDKGTKRRREMADGERPLDWSAAEALAIGSLALEGCHVRLTGQDSERGTFSQRHAVLHDTESDEDARHHIFQHLGDAQAPVEVHNSPLSEAGVLGFEYGYSLDSPDRLVMWEAQFGDFANAAQVYIDQFLTSAEDKWNRLSGIVLLLPHGFEGQGPEHASARLERFLLLSAEHNIQVVCPTTPAQYFHVLRRQVVRPWRKPLVVMTPKSLLRHPRCVSSLDALSRGRFKRVIGDEGDHDNDEISRVLLCTGKIFYDLSKRRDELERDDVAIVRLEQLYPFPTGELRDALSHYADGTPVTWVQEEPWNMGAWPYLMPLLGCQLFDRMPFAPVTRPESASPATGSHAAHDIEQDDLLTRAFGGEVGDPCDGAEQRRRHEPVNTRTSNRNTKEPS